MDGIPVGNIVLNPHSPLGLSPCADVNVGKSLLAPCGPRKVKSSIEVEAAEVNWSGLIGGRVDDAALDILELSNQSGELRPVPVKLKGGIGRIGRVSRVA